MPVELQIEVVNSISLYSDLKALCLTSKKKKFPVFATPRVNYELDLKTGLYREETELIEGKRNYF